MDWRRWACFRGCSRSACCGRAPRARCRKTRHRPADIALASSRLPVIIPARRVAMDATGSTQQGGRRMSRTLNLMDILLTTGRHLFLMGRYTEALTPLTKLRGFRSLPDHVNEELQ